MPSPARIAGHPIHPMLVVFPIGLWGFSFICDLIYLLGMHNPLWRELAFYTIAGGIIGAVAAAIPGAMDLFSMTDARIKRIGMTHMVFNLTIVILFAIDLGMRSAGDPDAAGPVWLSALAIVLLVVSGWLGGEMVYVYGAGVEQGVKRK